MPDESLPLVPLAGSQLARHGSGVGRILDDMISSTLTTSQKEGALIPRCRIGDINFCEPDYRQMLLWADELAVTPEEVLQALWNEKDTLFHKLGPSYETFNRTYIQEGRLKRLYWDFGRLPIRRFDWIEDLKFEAIHFVGDALTRHLTLASPSLLSLHCFRCGFEELDLRSVPALQQLWCSHNQLAKLDLDLTPALEDLDCSSNQLTELQLGNSQFDLLDCSGNEIDERNLIYPNGLKSLFCDDNRLQKLDVRGIKELQQLHCSVNEITRLNLSESVSLQGLMCGYNSLNELDLSGTPMLESLYCPDNMLEELDLSFNPKITHLFCEHNLLKELDIRPLEHLEDLTYDRDRTRLIQRPDQNF
jgi:hypothetical protein